MNAERKLQLAQLLQIDSKRNRIVEINEQMQSDDLWKDHIRASELGRELKHLSDVVDTYDLAESDEDLKLLEDELMFSGEYDNSSAVLSIHAGAGGTEAQDWASMLVRMYERFAQLHNFKFNFIEQTLGEEAGIKSATFEIIGDRAYGLLKGEAGVHRLVRISPFDADKARHTSFALVEAIPVLPASQEVAIDPKDLKIDTFRSGGHGGQNVNKVETAVRITHIPTGFVVVAQNERSQAQNREKALSIIKGKLIVLASQQALDHISQLRGEHIQAAWGNQIRSYVLAPYQMVKDHRTNYETSDTKGVLDGKIDEFIDKYLKKSN